jgi:arginine decarboxylase
MLFKVPTTHFYTCGAAESLSRLNALDGAMFAAGLGNINLIRISSIIPPRSQLVAAHELPPGALAPAAYAAITSDLPGEVISAAVAVVYPENADQPGLVMEYSGSGQKQDIEAVVRRMAEEGMRMRGLKIRDLRSLAVQHRVEKLGTAFAAVVLWE